MPAVPDHVVARLGELTIETPSWGYGDSGTRFGVFPQPGRPRDVLGADRRRRRGPPADRPPRAPSRCTSRGTRSTTPASCAATSRRAGCASAPSTRTCSRTRTTSSARSPIPTPPSASRPTAHMLECVEIATALGSTAQSLWLADGTNYPGQDDLRARRRRMLDCLEEVYAALPAEQELLVEYKFFEPAFYATDLADWGSALLACLRLGERARVLVDLGHHAQGTNVEQIVALPRRRGPARRLPLQQPQVRRRRPDRRLGQPVRAVPDLLRARRDRPGRCRG